MTVQRKQQGVIHCLCVAWLTVALAAPAQAQPTAETRSTRPADRTAQAGAAGVLPSAGAKPDAEPQRRVALVIGNAAYRTLAPLKNARHDAEDMCTALGRLGFETQCLSDLPSRTELRRALLQFGAQLDARSVGLFYYAGHGVQVQGRNHLLPTTINPASVADLEAGSVALDEVFSVMRDARAALNVVVLDACRDDPFTATRGPRVTRGLAREEPPANSVLVYATAPGAVAVDGSGRNGLFTTHLLGEIERPGPQIGELLRAVARKVEQEARNQYRTEQVPYRSFSYSGVFCFAQCDDTRIAEEVLALKQQSEQAVRRIRELEALNASLESTRLPTQTPHTGQGADPDSMRQAEIRLLRNQIQELSAKSAQLEAYRGRITALEREARERDQQVTESLKRDEQRRSRPTGVPTF